MRRSRFAAIAVLLMLLAACAVEAYPSKDDAANTFDRAIERVKGALTQQFGMSWEATQPAATSSERGSCTYTSATWMSKVSLASKIDVDEAKRLFDRTLEQQGFPTSTAEKRGGDYSITATSKSKERLTLSTVNGQTFLRGDTRIAC